MLKASDFLGDGRLIQPSQPLIESPEITVIMPTYCRGDNGYLKRAIEGVLNQSFQSFELIIVDDGSIDGTAALIRGFQQQDRRILHLRHDINCGLPAIRVNEALAIARGKYIAYQFDDDRWTNDALAQLYGASVSQEKPSLVFGKAKIVLGSNTYELGESFSIPRIQMSNFIANNSVMHPRSFFQEMGGYDCHIAIRRLCDWDLWIRWSRQRPFVFLNRVISFIEAELEGSLGKTSEKNLSIFRMMIDDETRDRQLRSDIWVNRGIDDLSYFQRSFRPQLVKHAYEHLIQPWYKRHAPHLLQAGGLHRISKQALSLLITNPDPFATTNITINNFAKLESRPISSYYVATDMLQPDDSQFADIAVFHRCHDGATNQYREFAQRQGTPALYMMDDNFLSLHELKHYRSWIGPGSERREQLEKHLRGADMVAVYSPITKQQVQALNPRVKAMRTNIMRRHVEDSRMQSRIPGRFKVGYAGTNARQEEFEELWPALVKLSQELGNELHLHFYGFCPEQAKELRCLVTHTSYQFSYELYLQQLKDERFDVLLAPLDDMTLAKRSKCPIKFLEITAAGTIGIYSNAYPYESIIDGIHGFKSGHTPQEWHAALRQVYQMSASTRSRMWEAAKDRVLADFTTESQEAEFLLLMESTRLHGLLRDCRDSDGRPHTIIVINNVEPDPIIDKQLRHASIMHEYGFRTTAIIQDAGNAKLIQYVKERLVDDISCMIMSKGQLSAWIETSTIAWLQANSFDSELSQIAHREHIPFIVGEGADYAVLRTIVPRTEQMTDRQKDEWELLRELRGYYEFLSNDLRQRAEEQAAQQTHHQPDATSQPSATQSKLEVPNSQAKKVKKQQRTRGRKRGRTRRLRATSRGVASKAARRSKRGRGGLRGRSTRRLAGRSGRRNRIRRSVGKSKKL